MSTLLQVSRSLACVPPQLLGHKFAVLPDSTTSLFVPADVCSLGGHDMPWLAITDATGAGCRAVVSPSVLSMSLVCSEDQVSAATCLLLAAVQRGICALARLRHTLAPSAIVRLGTPAWTAVVSATPALIKVNVRGASSKSGVEALSTRCVLVRCSVGGRGAL